MSSTRHSDSDGSDIFWPGYVDAVTNLVLNLLFLLTIMTVAVFMFALELGRASRTEVAAPPAADGKQKADGPATKPAADPVKEENQSLKREIQRLNEKLALQDARLARAAKPAVAGQFDKLGQPGRTELPGQLDKLGQPGRTELPGQFDKLGQPGRTELPGQLDKLGQPGRTELPGQLDKLGQPGRTELPGQLDKLGQPDPATRPGGPVKTVEATANPPRPQSGLDQTVTTDAEIVVRFTDEAVAFTPAEREKLRETLKPVAARGRASIKVVVPPGFSEARRLGYYRAMEVRNLLIEMKIPGGNIDISVTEGKYANASHVRVK